ncbi:MAG: PspC domain-containing protein [Vicingaceae bacterium]
MNQTVTVNISGIVFHIEVDAYEDLKKYLNKIRSYFKNAEESEEIMTDIEARIAELFNEKITEQNQVVNTKDVDEVITIMGKPEQYVEDGEEMNEKTYSSSQKTYSTAKKLFRDPDERMIGGVASGIAAYFGISPIWIRILFIIFVSFGVITYFVLWMVIPEAKTASDKLQMKGDPVNIDNISKTFTEEAEKVSDHFKKNGQQYGRKAETFFESIFNFIAQLLRGIINVFGKVFGVIFLFIGTFLMVGLLGMLIGSETIFSITTGGIFSLEASEFFNLIFVSENQFHMAVVAAILVIGVPFALLIYAGVKLLFKVKTHAAVGVGMFVLWIIGVSMCAMVGIRMGTELTHDDEIIDIETIQGDMDEFFISANIGETPGRGILEDRYSVISLDEDSIYFNDIRLRIFKSSSDSMELKLIKSSNGNSRKDAINNAKEIGYDYSVADSSIILSNYLSVLKEDKIRGQQVILKLYLPVGKSIYLDKSLKHIIYNVANVTDTWDRTMLGEKWVMLEEGLTCLDCEEIEGITSEQLDSVRTYIPEVVEE